MEKKNLRGEILSANQYKKYSVEYFPSRILFSVHVCIISKNQKIVHYQTKGNKIAILWAKQLNVISSMIQTLYVLTYNIILKLKSHSNPYPVLFATSVTMVILMHQYIIFPSSVVSVQCFHYFKQCLVNVFITSCL